MHKSNEHVGHFARKAGLGLMLVSLVALSACNAANRHSVTVGSIPEDYRTNHPIILSEQETTVDIPIASSDRRLTVTMREGIRGFVNEYRASSAGTVTMLVPTGSSNSGAAAFLATEIRDFLGEEGIARQHVVTANYHAESVDDAAPIRLVFSGITASTAPCGRWPDDLIVNTSENRNYANFGCATQSNLAAQLANPADIITPRGVTPVDAQRRQFVIGGYRNNGAIGPFGRDDAGIE